VEKRDLQCSCWCRTEGERLGGRFLRQKLIYVCCQLVGVCVCVCVCERERERERFNSPQGVQKEPGDPSTMDLLVYPSISFAGNTFSVFNISSETALPRVPTIITNFHLFHLSINQSEEHTTRSPSLLNFYCRKSRADTCFGCVKHPLSGRMYQNI
jgi:hypothetical protein